MFGFEDTLCTKFSRKQGKIQKYRRDEKVEFLDA